MKLTGLRSTIKQAQPLEAGIIQKEQRMLILTRRVGETLMIGDEVTVTVLGVKGNQVRIGVNAPKEVAGAEGFEPPTIGFGDRCSTNWNYAPSVGGAIIQKRHQR